MDNALTIAGHELSSRLILGSGGATSHAALDTQQLSNFNGGVYKVWNITGHVIVQVTHTGSGLSAVVSGLFFDPAS